MKSSFSNPSGNCVDVVRVRLGAGDERVAVRNDRQQDGPVVYFTKFEWEAFLMGVNCYEMEWEKIPFEGDSVPTGESQTPVPG